MENGYEILWTDLALEELAETVGYLEREFTQKEIDNLGDEIERIILIISFCRDVNFIELTYLRFQCDALFENNITH